MAHIVNTSVAAVKISGSFSAPDFSSSEEEGEDEIPTERRSRSNAVSESPLSSMGSDFTTASQTNNGQAAPSNSGNKSLTKSISNTSYATEASSPSSNATALSSPPLAAVISQDKIGSLVQKENTDTSQISSPTESDSTTEITSHVNNELGDTAVTLKNRADKDSVNVSGPPTNSEIASCDGQSQLSQQGQQMVSSSPVMMKRSGTHGQNSANGNLSSASGASSVSSSRELYHQSRFNPFDRDIHIEEDHFSDNPDGNFFGRGNSSPTSALSSRSSDHWNEEGPFPGDNDTVTFAELGLAEDHFSHPEGHFGFSKTEELEMAIDNCKALIRKASPDSDRQKNLVQTLVQLRLKLQELKEEPAVQEKNVVSALGHRLLRKESRSTKYYCEKCNGIIWGLVQEWRKCQDCGYRCHDKCVPQITRNCAMVKVKENPVFSMEICPRNPKGLLAQDYRCAECKAQISVADGVEPRLCEYSGRYYCELCHWNDLMYIPAQILLNWEFEKHKVCRSSKQFLKLMMKKAVINVQEINPMLFNYVEQLSDIKNLREELLLMKKYILACPSAMQAKLLRQLSSRPHFVECSDRYSMQDLLDSDEMLIPELVQVHSSWAQHIKTDCELCQGRGYFCELCTSKEVLFPFDNIAVVCPSCSSVMHRICFAQQVICPKCERRRKRQARGDNESKT